jgi:putative flavoprotein involved in K+ transport
MLLRMIDTLVIGGGQSGLAAAYALREAGLEPVIVEAGEQAAGSWPRYYDSLTLFSPARYSSLPGLPFGGAPDRYPHRDEVTGYLLRYAAWLDTDIRTGHRVTGVETALDGDADGFEVTLEGGQQMRARSVVAATGGFGRPHRPALPGLDQFTGTVLHAADYRTPDSLAGRRVVVVGAGNSAVQIAAELAGHATVTLASRSPIRLMKQRPLGRDVHFWFTVTGLDTAPIGRWMKTPPTTPVLDQGGYRTALAAGRPGRRPMFTGIDQAKVTWADGSVEQIEAIVLATGYRPDVGYLKLPGALDEQGHPRHKRGISTAHPGLGFVGLEWQHSLSSATLRGVGRDAAHIAARLARTL